MATVIDSLVVMLGLDASKYKKGREEAQKETSETARVVKNSADDITKSLSEVGRTIAGLFLGFESISGLTKWLGALNADEAALGRTAKTLGLTGHELNKWGNAVALAGGSATDAQDAFKTLTTGVTKFLSGQGTSPILDLLRLAGVSAVDATGKIRNQGEVYEELARKTAKWGSVIQAQRLRAAGINEGEINYLLLADELRAQLLAKAEASNNVNETSIAEAQRLQQEWRQVSQEITAAGQSVIKDLAPAVLSVLHTVSKIAESFRFVIDTLSFHDKNSPEEIEDRKRTASTKYAGYIKEHPGLADGRTTDQVAAEAAEKIRLGPPSANDAYIPPKAGTLAARNNNPGNLEDKNGKFRKFSTMLEGQAALDSDIDTKISNGYDTIAKIITRYAPPSENNTAGYIDYVSKQLGKGANDKVSHYDTGALIQAITNYESGNRPNTGKNNAAAGAGNTTVQIDAIHVNAPQADPRAVAEQVPAAIQRRFSVTQAAQGQS